MEFQRGAYVGPLRLHPCEPRNLLRSEPFPLSAFDEVQVPVGMPAAHRRLGVRSAEALRPVLAQRVQQPVPDLPGLRPHLQNGLGNEPVEDAENRLRIDPVHGADVRRGSQVEAAHEHRQPRPHRLLLRRAKIEAPVHRGTQRALVPCPGAVAGVEHREPIVQPMHEMLDRQDP